MKRGSFTPNRSWYSFTDRWRMEDWVGPGGTSKPNLWQSAAINRVASSSINSTPALSGSNSRQRDGLRYKHYWLTSALPTELNPDPKTKIRKATQQVYKTGTGWPVLSHGDSGTPSARSCKLFAGELEASAGRLWVPALFDHSAFLRCSIWLLH